MKNKLAALQEARQDLINKINEIKQSKQTVSDELSKKKQDLDIKINDFKHTEKKIDDKLAEIHTTKQNVDNKINEVSQSKQTETKTGTTNANNNARELPNAGSEQSNNMALGMLSVLGGILLVTRNKIKTLFSK